MMKGRSITNSRKTDVMEVALVYISRRGRSTYVVEVIMPCPGSPLDDGSREGERTATTITILGGNSQSFVTEAIKWGLEGEVVRWEGREDMVSWR